MEPGLDGGSNDGCQTRSAQQAMDEDPSEPVMEASSEVPRLAEVSPRQHALAEAELWLENLFRDANVGEAFELICLLYNTCDGPEHPRWGDMQLAFHCILSCIMKTKNKKESNTPEAVCDLFKGREDQSQLDILNAIFEADAYFERRKPVSLGKMKFQRLEMLRGFFPPPFPESNLRTTRSDDARVYAQLTSEFYDTTFLGDADAFFARVLAKYERTFTYERLQTVIEMQDSTREDASDDASGNVLMDTSEELAGNSSQTAASTSNSGPHDSSPDQSTRSSGQDPERVFGPDQILPTPYHSRSLAVVQSSGTGKSRLIQQLNGYIPPDQRTATLHLTFYLCFRPKNESGFPLGDWRFLAWLSEDVRKGLPRSAPRSGACYEVRWITLLRAIYQASFASIHDYHGDSYHTLAQYWQQTSSPKKGAGDAWSHEGHLDVPLYDEVQETANKLWLEVIRDLNANSYKHEAFFVRKYRTLLRADALALETTLAARVRAEQAQVWFHVCLDELANIRPWHLKAETKAEKLAWVEDLRSLFCPDDETTLLPPRFWIIMLGTNASFATPRPALPVTCSSRVESGKRRHLPPYTHPVQNVWLKADAARAATILHASPLQASRVHVLALWGRPLWRSRIVYDKVDPILGPAELACCGGESLTFVLQKLLRLPIATLDFSTISLDTSRLFALLGRRIALDDGAGDEESCGTLSVMNPAEQKRQVDEHLRMLHNISKAGDIFSTTRHMVESSEDIPSAHGSVDSPAAWNNLLKDAKNCWVNFTSFSRAGERIQQIDFGHLQRAWLRMTAIVGAGDQEKWDLVIPVYCGSISASLQLEAFTFIEIRVESRKQPYTQIQPPSPTPILESLIKPPIVMLLNVGMKSANTQEVTVRSYPRSAGPHIRLANAEEQPGWYGIMTKGLHRPNHPGLGKLMPNLGDQEDFAITKNSEDFAITKNSVWVLDEWDEQAQRADDTRAGKDLVDLWSSL
ncbi:hypothetical protein CBOM_04763 [Ceraceosorus bombacis]|uniref:Uncharacterized protein n=1 Tax=Ceraceosorus bombacis TaxID=401625 RepID=A0A0N7LB44_9BASI|nr:hypothetical protein CBOM_04763 [Ceraceosorus bombacis]